MFIKSIKNYFKCLKYFFIPLGTMFLGLLAGISVLFPGIVSAIDSLVAGIKLLADEVNIDFVRLWEEIRGIITELNWDDPMSSVQTMLSSEWVNDTLTHSLNNVLGDDICLFSDRIRDLIDVFVSDIAVYMSAFVLLFALSFMIGFVLTKLFVRKNIAKRTLLKWLLTNVINAALTVIVIIMSLFFFVLWHPSAPISLLFILVMSSVVSLFGAYFVYGLRRVKFEHVVNVKNIFMNILANLLIFIISAVIITAAVCINVLMGTFVGLAIIEIAMCVTNMNAESYVQGLLDINHDKVKIIK